LHIQLPTGNTIIMSTYDFLFNIKDEDMPLFWQHCVAENLGVYIDNPFSEKGLVGLLKEDDETE
jgi:hypothetical protein